MNDLFTLAEIAKRAKVAVNRLRYVIDSEILPGNREGIVEWRSSQGVTRKYTSFEVFGIVLAVVLLDNGLRRAVVMQVLDLVCGYTRSRTRDLRFVPLNIAYLSAKVSALQIGDGVNLRFIADAPDVGGLPANAWLQVETKAKVEGFDPLVIVELNLAKLRQLWKS
jgi:hypothetical protein